MNNLVQTDSLPAKNKFGLSQFPKDFLELNEFPIESKVSSGVHSSNMTSSSVFVTSKPMRKLKGSGPGSFRKRASIQIEDRKTDSDIFSLGSAFREANFNIDDFFKNMPPVLTSPGHVNGEQTVQTVTTTKNGTVTTIRRIRTPNINTEVIRTTPDGISNAGIPQLGIGFDNVRKDERPVRSEVRVSQYEGVTDSSADHGQPLSEKSVPEIRTESVEDTPEGMKPEVQPPPPPPPLASAKEDDGASEVELSSSEEMETDRLLWQGGKKKGSTHAQSTQQIRRQRVHDKGKAGMTASQVAAPVEQEKLPTAQLMVIHFSRMLDEDPDQFADVLFRAVKLNGLDVVKVLCELVIRKGYRLSSERLRERESSATVLHVALLCKHESMADYLIELNDKQLNMSVYTKREYRKQTTLHVAIGNRSHRLVDKLLASLSRPDRKALINTVADGSYFVRSHPDGQLCLTAAAWAADGDLIVTLAKHGANFALSDVDGNTLMHRLVWSSSARPNEMDYELMVEKVLEAIGEWARRRRYDAAAAVADQRRLERRQRQVNAFRRLLTVQNDDGETPLSLAARLSSRLLGYLLNLEGVYKIPQTRLGSISWVTYDVTEVSTLASGQYSKFSVLHVLAHNGGKLSRHANLDEPVDAVDPLDAEPIGSLIRMKWRVYRYVYVVWLFVHLVFIVLFTYFTFDEYSAGVTEVDDRGGGRVIRTSTHLRINYGLGAFLVLPVVYVVLELIDWFGLYPYSVASMRNRNVVRRLLVRIKSEWVITGNGPYRFVCLAHSLLTIAWYAMYVSRTSGQDVALSLALLLGWIFVLFFTRGCPVTSRFSIMIQKMFFRDLMYFLAVYVVILAAFSISISAMFSYARTSRTEFPSVMYQMLNIVTDLDQRAHATFEKDDQRPLFTKMLVIFYAIVAVVLLMNMLIAMMNTSYETVRITKCNLCKQQQLSIMLMLERRLFWLSALSFKSEEDVWFKNWDDSSVRAYLDVTTTSSVCTSNGSKAGT